MSKEDLMKKWAPILGSLGMTGSQLENLSQLAENQSNQILNENYSGFSSILPLATKVAAQTISQNLVPVQPLSSMMSQEELDRINNEVKSKNRDGKIESLIEGKEFKEMKPEDHPDWEKLPTGKLFYLDFKYGHKKTRRAGKKHKKKNV